MTRKLLFAAACVAIPILWGVFVNWMFDRWLSRVSDKPEDETVFSDYQI